MQKEQTDPSSTDTKDPGAFTIQLPANGLTWRNVERDLVRQALERANGNQTIAAELLGIRRDALRRRLIKYGFLTRPSDAAPLALAEAA